MVANRGGYEVFRLPLRPEDPTEGKGWQDVEPDQKALTQMVSSSIVFGWPHHDLQPGDPFLNLVFRFLHGLHRESPQNCHGHC